MSGTKPRPQGDVLGSREPRHVDLAPGDDHLGDALADAGDGPQSSGRVSKRGHHPVDLRIETGDSLGELIHAVQMHPREEAVVSIPPADERPAQFGDLRANTRQSHLGEYSRGALQR
jgi:hypothetical protein